MSGNPFTSKWNTDYAAINYANLFLKDRAGISARYLIDLEADAAYRKTMQGSVFGLRAWYGFDLLRTFAGKGTDGNMLGVPIVTEPTSTDKIDVESIRRAGVDECVKQILDDCDSAYFYLPDSNRDYPGEPAQNLPVTGSVRYKTLDRVCIDAIRAMVWLFWASPAFNPEGDVQRYEKAALYASRVIKHKIEGRLAHGRFQPAVGIQMVRLQQRRDCLAIQFLEGHRHREVLLSARLRRTVQHSSDAGPCGCIPYGERLPDNGLPQRL